MPTARDVAEWMLQEVIFRELDQDYAAHNIQRIFGGEFVYENANGNWAINRNVLKEFRKITGTLSSGSVTLAAGENAGLTTSRDGNRINAHALFGHPCPTLQWREFFQNAHFAPFCKRHIEMTPPAM
jgi:hypothetical protein